MQHGGTLPHMFAVLDAAREWGAPPWTFAGDNPVVWYWRRNYYNNQRDKARKSKWPKS